MMGVTTENESRIPPRFIRATLALAPVAVWASRADLTLILERLVCVPSFFVIFDRFDLGFSVISVSLGRFDFVFQTPSLIVLAGRYGPKYIHKHDDYCNGQR
jgi:hypothetical protein